MTVVCESGQQLAYHTGWAAQFPVKDLIRHGLIDKTSGQAATVAALLRYFGVSSPDAWESQWAAAAVAFRGSRTYESSPFAAAAWLRWGELLAKEIETHPYSPRQLRSVLQGIRPLTRREIALTRERIEGLFASAGVALVMTPELSNLRLSGAARWRPKNRIAKPTLTVRPDWLENREGQRTRAKSPGNTICAERRPEAV